MSTQVIINYSSPQAVFLVWYKLWSLLKENPNFVNSPTWDLSVLVMSVKWQASLEESRVNKTGSASNTNNKFAKWKLILTVMNDDWLQGELNIFDLNQYQIVIDEMTICIELITEYLV